VVAGGRVGLSETVGLPVVGAGVGLGEMVGDEVPDCNTLTSAQL